MHKPLFPLIALVWTISLTAAAGEEIYRVVDENGNVVYTDQKPEDDAEPVELPELNVLDDENGEAPIPPPDGGDSAGARESMQFVIEQPADGDEIAASGDVIEVVMDIAIDIPPTAEIVLILDGEELEPVRSLELAISAPPPGEHRLQAELRTPAGRVLGATETVRFTTVAAAGD